LPQRIGASRRTSPSLAGLTGPPRRNPRTRRFRACRGARSGVRWAASRACLGPLGVSGGFGRVRRLLGAGARVSGDIRRYGCPARPGQGIRTFSVSRLQSEAAVDPHRNDGPSRPETTRAESVEPPYTTPFGNGADTTTSVGKLPDRPLVTVAPPHHGQRHATDHG
jgi:hypothetical protein